MDNAEDLTKEKILAYKEKCLIALNDIIAKIQGDFAVNKTNKNAFLNFEYRTADELMCALKPYMAKYGVHVQITHEELLSVKCQSFEKPLYDNKGEVIKDATGRVKMYTVNDYKTYLKMKAVVYYKNVKSEPFYTFTDLATKEQKGLNSSQIFGMHESYAKKRALGNLFLVGTDEGKFDPDATMNTEIREMK